MENFSFILYQKVFLFENYNAHFIWNPFQSAKKIIYQIHCGIECLECNNVLFPACRLQDRRCR